jgi:4'-phosphopantetheinyl transferase
MAGEAAAMSAAQSAPPRHIGGPEGPWEPLHDVLDTGHLAVLHTTWGEWLTATLFDPALRPTLGRDWQRYRHTRDASARLVFGVSRMVVKHTAAAVLHVPPGSLDLAYRLGGRPWLRGLGDDLEVSLTHTGELIAVAVSTTGPVGVDAEPLDRKISFDLLRDHICTPEEAAELAELPAAERDRRLLRLWTLKEAYTKALGHGLWRRFSTFGFRMDDAGGAFLDGNDGDTATAGAWRFATHVVHDRYLVSTAHGPGGSGGDVPAADDR